MPLLLLLLVSFVLVSPPAQAVTILTSHLSPGSVDAEELKSDQEWGQTFELTFGSAPDVGLDCLMVYLFREGNSGGDTITASLRTSWNGAPVWQSTIAHDSIEFDSSVDKNSLHAEVMFAGPQVTLSTNTQYYLRLDTTAGSKVWIHFDNGSSSYSPGNMVNKDGNSQGSGKDLVFAVPEPSAVLLLGLGLAGLNATRRVRS